MRSCSPVGATGCGTCLADVERVVAVHVDGRAELRRIARMSALETKAQEAEEEK